MTPKHSLITAIILIGILFKGSMMIEKPKILFLFTLIITSCKYLPNQTRTSGSKISSEKIYNSKEITFSRNTNFTAGTLKFQINQNYTCEVSYWTDNPNVTPNKNSPVVYSCPKLKMVDTNILHRSLVIR